MLTDRIEFLLPRGLSRGAANRPKQQLLTALIFCVDRWYTHKPNCIFRAQLQRLHTEVVLSDGTLGRVGDRVIDLHFWNEQIPTIPAEGPSLAWGHQVSTSFGESLREFADNGVGTILSDGKVTEAVALSGVMSIRSCPGGSPPHKASVVRSIFRNYAAGQSPRGIARKLNEKGIPGPLGRPWRDTTIRGHFTRGTGILNNELCRVPWCKGCRRRLRPPTLPGCVA